MWYHILAMTLGRVYTEAVRRHQQLLQSNMGNSRPALVSHRKHSLALEDGICNQLVILYTKYPIRFHTFHCILCISFLIFSCVYYLYFLVQFVIIKRGLSC